MKTEVKPEPETTKKGTKTATEVPEPSGIEPFKETYFDEDNHVHYFRQVQVFNILSSTTHTVDSKKSETLNKNARTNQLCF